MRKFIGLMTFFSIFNAPGVALAGFDASMKKECINIARSMMETPASFKLVDAKPASRDQNTGVAIQYAGSKAGFSATLSCFYAKGEISKLHLDATLQDGEKVNDYLADALVQQIKKNIK